MFRLALLFMLVCSCGGPSPALPPLAPMAPGATWDGAWSTTFGTLELVATGLSEAPFASAYAFGRDAAPLHGQLTCSPPADNHLYCVTDEATRGVIVLVMQPDGRSFVGNWWLDRDRWIRWQGTRDATARVDPGPHPRVAAWVDPPLPEGATLRIGHALPHGEVAGPKAFSSGGELLAWSDRRGTHVEVVATGERGPDVATHVSALAYSPDGARLAGVEYGGQLHVWTRDGHETLGPTWRATGVQAVTFTPDGAAIVVASLDALAWFDVEDPSRWHELAVPDGGIRGLAFSRTGTLVTWGDRGWSTWTADGVPTSFAARSRNFAVSPVADVIAYEHGEQVRVAALDGSVYSALDVDLVPAAYTPDGRTLLGAEAYPLHAVIAVDAKTGREQARFPCTIGPLVLSPDGRTMAVGNQLLDLARGIRLPDDAAMARLPIGFSRDGATLYTSSRCGLEGWDVATGARVDHADTPDTARVSPSGQRVVDHRGTAELIVREVGGGVLATRTGQPYDLAWIDDDHLVFEVVEGADHHLVSWEISTDTVTTLWSTKHMMWALAASRDGREIAVGLSDDSVVRLDATTGKQLERRTKLAAVGLGYRDDGTLVLEQSFEGGASFRWERWELSPWKRQAQATAYSGDYIDSPAPQLSPDAATAGYIEDERLHVFETTTMQEVLDVPVDGSYALARGGTHAVVVDPDGSVLVYALAPR